MDRLRPVRATNPHAPSSQGSHPLALLSLAEDSLALNSSRVDCPSAWTGLLHLATSSTCQRCRRRGEADDARHPRTPKCICAQRWIQCRHPWYSRPRAPWTCCIQHRHIRRCAVAVPSSHVALLDPVLGKHDQGAAHGLGRHGLGPIRFGTARDWQRAEVGLAAGHALAVGMAALRVQGSSNGCWRPTRLLLGHKHWWCASNLHVFHLRRTARAHGIALCPGIGAHMLCTL